MTEIPEHPLEPVSGLESKIDSLVGDISVIKAGGGANVQQMREELERKLGEAEKKVVRSKHCYQYHLKRALFFMNDSSFIFITVTNVQLFQSHCPQYSEFSPINQNCCTLKKL